MLARSATGLILASASRTRRQMLEAAGVPFRVVPADLDEAAIRDELLARMPAAGPADIALALARAKAEAVSRAEPEALVIGSDQVLALGTRLFDKPVDLAAARLHLQALRGATHELLAAVALAQGGSILWDAGDVARLTVRDFSDAWLDAYLERAGDLVCTSVGAYQLEALGVHLFERIEGDHFTILGMPLLTLLAELRRRGVLLT